MTPPSSPKPKPRSHKAKNSKSRLNDGEDAKFLTDLGIKRKRNGQFGKIRPGLMVLQARMKAQKEAREEAQKKKEEAERVKAEAERVKYEAERKALLEKQRFPRECRLSKLEENQKRRTIDEVLSSDEEEEKEEDQKDKDYVFSTAYGKQRKRSSGIRATRKSGTGSKDKQMADIGASDEDDKE